MNNILLRRTLEIQAHSSNILTAESDGGKYTLEKYMWSVHCLLPKEMISIL